MLSLAEHNLSFHAGSCIVAKSVIKIVNLVGIFLSALGLHNYNKLLALHLQKVLALLHSFSSQNAPKKIQSQSTYFTIFWEGMPPDHAC